MTTPPLSVLSDLDARVAEIEARAALARLSATLATQAAELERMRGALEPFAKYHALDGVQNGHHEDELIVSIRGANGRASISYGDLRRAALLLGESK